MNSEERKEYNKNYYINNKKKILEKNRIWNTQHRDIVNKCVSNWSKSNPELREKNTRKYHLRTKYKITTEDYDKLLLLQNNSCAICLRENKEKYLSIDHCHKTGVIRGLLCRNCNLALGYLNDDIELFNNAINYLRSK